MNKKNDKASKKPGYNNTKEPQTQNSYGNGNTNPNMENQNNKGSFENNTNKR